MMPLRFMPFLLGILTCCLLAGCARKKPVLVMPQEPPPASAPTPAPTPSAETKDEPPQPQVSPTPAPSETPSATATNDNKAKPRPTPKKTPARSNGTTTAHNKPIIVPPGDAPPIPPPPSPEALSQQQATEQLLQSTESSIKGITRQLSKEEQAILAQIKDFIGKSRAAMQVNDFVQARNFAQKAHLLSDELVKQK